MPVKEIISIGKTRILSLNEFPALTDKTRLLRKAMHAFGRRPGGVKTGVGVFSRGAIIGLVASALTTASSKEIKQVLDMANLPPTVGKIDKGVFVHSAFKKITGFILRSPELGGLYIHAGGTAFPPKKQEVRGFSMGAGLRLGKEEFTDIGATYHYVPVPRLVVDTTKGRHCLDLHGFSNYKCAQAAARLLWDISGKRFSVQEIGGSFALIPEELWLAGRATVGYRSDLGGAVGVVAHKTILIRGFKRTEEAIRKSRWDNFVNQLAELEPSLSGKLGTLSDAVGVGIDCGPFSARYEYIGKITDWRTGRHVIYFALNPAALAEGAPIPRAARF